MANLRNRFPARRRFLKQSAALTASASLAAPMLVVAQPARDEAAAGTQSASSRAEPSKAGSSRVAPAALAPQAGTAGTLAARAPTRKR
jgi:hypothetical protein